MIHAIRLSTKAIEIVNALRDKRLDYDSEYVPIIEALKKLAKFEDAEEEKERLAKEIDAHNW